MNEESDRSEVRELMRNGGEKLWYETKSFWNFISKKAPWKGINWKSSNQKKNYIEIKKKNRLYHATIRLVNI